jgi:hypothetical protein
MGKGASRRARGWAGEKSGFFSILLEEDFDVPVDS